ncbi:peptidoglycan-binding domain-containing protein [Lutibaculum baratangense]|nr:peptidoglycan-binding protein [Lutibaculum baratangense]
MLRHPSRLIGAMAFAALWMATAVNALWMQAGHHPAPLVQSVPWDGPDLTAGAGDEPSRLPDYDRGLVRDIQSALAERGFYSGELDGLYGPGTQAAIERYGDAAAGSIDPQPTPALLAHIQLSGIDASAPAGGTGQEHASLETAMPAPAEPKPRPEVQGDPAIAKIQRVLADLGYAPGPIDGQWGNSTSGAIRRFQADRGLVTTGEMGDEVLAELSRVSGVELR